MTVEASVNLGCFQSIPGDLWVRFALVMLHFCIHGLLPPEKKLQTVLRSTHCFQLPFCHYKTFKDSFINRLVFKDAY